MEMCLRALAKRLKKPRLAGFLGGPSRSLFQHLPERSFMARSSMFLSILCLVAVIPLSGCQKIEARMEMKKGNSAYKLEKYKDALEFFQRGLDLDPDATF